MEDAAQIVTRSLDALPIFPLPDAVLLPHELLPLHVFETRYREMTAHVLKDQSAMAVACFEPGFEANYEGRPPVKVLCGIGLIVRSETLPDGCYNILLRGVARAQIEQELGPRRAYREVRARLLDDQWPSQGPQALQGPAEGLRTMVLALCTSAPGPTSDLLAQLVAKADDPAELADIVLAAAATSQPERRLALETLNVEARIEQARTAVTNLLALSTFSPAATRH